MRRLSWLAVLMVLVPVRVAQACSGGGGDGPVMTTRVHPDQPLRLFAQGNLGILRPEYARTYLVVAYRYLAGIPLDASEQAGALAAWEDRGVAQICEAGSPPTNRPPAPPRPLETWQTARKTVTGSVNQTLNEGYLEIGGESYGAPSNCLDDAFVTAARTLAAREKTYGAGSAALKAWVARQDAVFANCQSKTPVAVPAPPEGDAVARADFAYQKAAAAFYARDWNAAEQGFRAVAADAGSPWQGIARYLVARTLVRKADVLGGGDDANKARTAAAEHLARMLEDSSVAPLHEAARGYQRLVSARLDREATAAKLSVDLGKGMLGPAFGRTLIDYAFLHGAESEGTPQTSTPSSDRLGHWIETLRRGDFDAAEALYLKTKSPVWLAAALITARPNGGARVDRLLGAASTIDRKSPAYPTVRFHRLRLLVARKEAKGVAEELAATRQSLRPEDGPSAANDFQALAFATARSLDELLAQTLAHPAGVDDGDEWGIIPAVGREKILGPFPAAAQALSFELPTARLVEAARSEKIPPNLRLTLLVATYVRAGLLEDRAAAAALAPLVKKQAPLLAKHVDRIEGAASEPQRRFELLYALATMQELSPLVPTWRTLQPTKTGLGGFEHWWCQVAEPPKGNAPAPVAFETAAEWAAARQEWQRLRALGSGATFLNTALADLAPQIADARLAEALHVAVASSRRECRDNRTTAAAKRAFVILHKRFPKSDWARQTKRYY
jgi:hypothetical protein